jgi:hypothetical protein
LEHATGDKFAERAAELELGAALAGMHGDSAIDQLAEHLARLLRVPV